DHLLGLGLLGPGPRLRLASPQLFGHAGGQVAEEGEAVSASTSLTGTAWERQLGSNPCRFGMMTEKTRDSAAVTLPGSAVPAGTATIPFQHFAGTTIRPLAPRRNSPAARGGRFGRRPRSARRADVANRDVDTALPGRLEGQERLLGGEVVGQEEVVVI